MTPTNPNPDQTMPTTTANAARTPKQAAPKRWTILSVPGREDDGSDTAWFAFGRAARPGDRRRSVACGSFAEARAECRRRNGAEMA